MDIGKPQRIIEVIPLKVDVPETPEPKRAPPKHEPVKKPEKVDA